MTARRSLILDVLLRVGDESIAESSLQFGHSVATGHPPAETPGRPRQVLFNLVESETPIVISALRQGGGVEEVILDFMDGQDECAECFVGIPPRLAKLAVGRRGKSAVRLGAEDYQIRAEFAIATTFGGELLAVQDSPQGPPPKPAPALPHWYFSSWRAPLLVGPVDVTVGKPGRRPAQTGLAAASAVAWVVASASNRCASARRPSARAIRAASSMAVLPQPFGPARTTRRLGLPSGPRKSKSRFSMPRKSRIDRDTKAIGGELDVVGMTPPPMGGGEVSARPAIIL